MRDLLISLSLAFVVALIAGSGAPFPPRSAMPQEPTWNKVDSLSRLGQYASALHMTEELLSRAQATGDWRAEFRAWMYKGRLAAYTGADPKEVLAAMEARTATSTVPLKPLLHSVLGEQWWNYYQRDRWRVLERTNLAEPTNDPDTWDQATFMRKVIAAYTASLTPRRELSTIAVEDLAPLLQPQDADPRYRPTLYDLLAHRALDVFRNSETRLAEPASRFQLDDPQLFASPAAFAEAGFTSTDTTSWSWQAIRLYQELTAVHLDGSSPAALAHVTLERLAFAWENSTLPGKDSLQLRALEHLRAQTQEPAPRAAVILAIAQWHADRAAQYQRNIPDSNWKWEKRTAALICREVIEQKPDAYAEKKAKALLARLEQPGLKLTTEQAVAPDAPFRLAVEHTHLKHLWLRVVADGQGPDETNRYRSREALERLMKQPPLHTWEVALQDDGDLQAHLAEVPVEGLPLGRYGIIASSSPDPAASEVVSVVAVQVTSLAMTVRRMEENASAILVMDRQSGNPVKGASVTLSSQEYRGGRTNLQTIGTATTDADGMAEIPEVQTRNGYRRWAVTLGKDGLVTDAGYFWWPSGRGTTDSLRTFLFMDRAIYCPGQPVLFKGIVTVERGDSTAVKPGHTTSVLLVDGNWQPVDSIQVTTDAYGAFHGEFTAPQGVLTGIMTLREAHGSRSFRVEEYKRPTFEVTFPPADSAGAADAAKLGREAAIRGVAKSYAGVPLDGAGVQWRVTRTAHRPWWLGGWWWSGFPWGRPTEVARGTAETDVNGRFTVHFTPEADRTFPGEADPVFRFNVEVSVTDLNGETQAASTAISVGHRSIDIALAVGEAIDRTRTDSLPVAVQDLNGNPINLPMDVRITRLAAPARPLRDRLWAPPDRHVLSEAEFKELFPEDPFANEDDPLTWPRGTIVLERAGWRANGQCLPLAGIKGWDVGMYLIEVSARDADGKEVKVKKAVPIHDPGVQHTGFVGEALHVEVLNTTVEPGESAVLLLSTALAEAHLLMEVERHGRIAVRRWFTLKKGQQRVELPVLESDRGGFAVHVIGVERGRVHNRTVRIEVPWSNKELKVEWMTFRDKLLPGATEEWRLRITGPKGEQVAAQLLAGMYDASLDHFVPHDWAMPIWRSRFPKLGWDEPFPFGMKTGDRIGRIKSLPTDTLRVMPKLNTFGFSGYMGYGADYRSGALMNLQMVANEDDRMPPPAMEDVAEEALLMEAEASTAEDRAPVAQDVPQPATRTDFRETAFFLPDLLTDKDGSVILRFTMPEALTRWKLLGLAHTADLETAHFTKEVITQKPLMVTPNLPRFLREGDAITLTAKVAVVEGGPVEGTARLELFDPFTSALLNDRFNLEENTRGFTAGPGASAAVAWPLHVPAGLAAVGVRITATASTFSDGEQKPLPILTDRVLVTESLPLPISKAGTRTFTLEKLKHDTSTTLRHEALKLEFTPNPAWYAVQALPYLMEYPHLCSEQVFSRLYANSLAAHIVDERPRIKTVFAQWSAADEGGAKGNAPGTLLSNLEKNSELKNIILAETPWVLNAASERERKQRIGLLFDMQRMAAERGKALKQLREAQLGNGAWPWFSGMQPSRWVTQGIVAGLGHLEKLGAADLRPEGRTQQMLKNAVRWLDGEVVADHARLLKITTAKQRESWTPGHEVVQYLYARSFFPRWAIAGATSTAVDFYKARLAATWLNFGLQEQAMIAVALDRMGDRETARLIMKSLGERATRSEELGMYWKNFNAGYHWWTHPTETHSRLIEAFHEVAKDEQAVNELRLYLLKLKQTTDWKTTKATAQACYALLLTGDDWLEDAGTPRITVGDEEVHPDRQEAGTGYFQHSWSGEEITPAMGQVSVTTRADRAAWGALHWQYFEQMDKVTAAESPFSIRKQVLLKETGPEGTQLVALDKARTLEPGDKLTIRIELRTDRAMDYVHLKDLRASGLEPTETLSGYRYKGGLGWYQSTRDAATDFFFDHLAPGTYVLEYDLRIAHVGDFSNGITTALCMYAPEFASHSEGVRIRVGE